MKERTYDKNYGYYEPSGNPMLGGGVKVVGFKSEEELDAWIDEDEAVMIGGASYSTRFACHDGYRGSWITLKQWKEDEAWRKAEKAYWREREREGKALAEKALELGIVL